MDKVSSKKAVLPKGSVSAPVPVPVPAPALAQAPASKPGSAKALAQAPSVEDVYKKKNPREHVLDLPGMYIGSIENDYREMRILDNSTGKIIEKTIQFVPGFYKTFDELLVNARDHFIRELTCDEIRVEISKAEGKIVVSNNGEGLPAVLHKEHQVYIPELVFGHLLTSTNYDKKGKTVGGKNGFGAKLANIFSRKFIVETIDTVNGKKYLQEFSNNMSVIAKPEITKISKGTKPYTTITYYPDFARFNLDGFTDDIIALFNKRVYDIAASTTGTSSNLDKGKKKVAKVYLNNKLITIKTFLDFIKLHYDSAIDITYDDSDPRWKIGVVFDKESGHKQVSYVNGIWTYGGGTHVNYILEQIIKKIIDFVKLKHKIVVKPAQIKEYLTIFVDSIIDDPDFPSQSKEILASKVSSFGTKYEVEQGFMNKLYKTGILEEVVKYAQFKEMSNLKKTDGKKTTSLIGIPKLVDAHLAGTKNSKDTRLIITEGDSALAFALSGIEVIGRERYGAWPLKGKSLNVRNATITQIKNNQEFNDFKTIMGLKHDTEYIDVSKLRYGGIIILADQDLDGSHIKGLIINMLQFFWPSLLKIEGFIQTIATPIIKAFKKTDKKKDNPKIFQTMSEFEHWKTHEMNDNISKWEIKYYKGLGTSTAREAKEVFSEFENKIINYIWELPKDMSIDSDDSSDSDSSSSSEVEYDESSDEEQPRPKKKKNKNALANAKLDDSILNSKSYDAITLAFSEDRVYDRKKWLKRYDSNNILEYDNQFVSYSDFVNKDLIHFSNYDNIRMIPSICDGLKPSQRKILYGCFKKRIGQKEVKVAQLAAYISEHSAYKHGEKSLIEAIINMAQNFPGRNNLNLLYPSGNFGSRNLGGDDSADGRYIFTYLETITEKIFRPEDDVILNYLTEEGDKIEPQYYLPIIPMVLINGVIGLGYGYSTKIMPHDPLEVANNIMRKLNEEPLKDMIPSFYRYNGEIKKLEDKKFIMKGCYEIVDDETIKITEFPVLGLYAWTYKYSKFLESLLPTPTDKDNSDDKIIYDVKSDSSNNIVCFHVKFKGNELQKLLKKGHSEVEKFFKLSVNFNISNMYLYNPLNHLHKYNDVSDIIDEYYDFRLNMYAKRKDYMIQLLANELKILKYKVKFIKDVIDEKIIIAKQKREKIIEKITSLKYPKLSTDPFSSEEDKSYNYLTNMGLFSLTLEKIEELNGEYETKQKEYDDYVKITTKELWKRELKEFIEAYTKWDIERKEDIKKEANIKKNKKLVKKSIKKS